MVKTEKQQLGQNGEDNSKVGKCSRRGVNCKRAKKIDHLIIREKDIYNF